MKRIINVFMCVVVVVLVSASGHEKTKTLQMKDQAELKETWGILGGKLHDNPELWKQAEKVLERYKKGYSAEVKKDALQQLYRLISNPKTKASVARRALEVFIKLEATEVIRESLLHPRWDFVIMACEALVDQATKMGVRDEAALPYLTHVLAKNNYSQPGSEDATIHRIMKRKLIKAIQQITGIDKKVTDVDNIQEVERFLTLARGWADRKGVKLFGDIPVGLGVRP